MKSNHTTHEFDFHFVHRVEVDFSPLLRSFVMGLFEDLNAKVDDVQTQVISAIDTLKSGVGGDPSLNVTADQKTQLFTKLDDFTAAVKSAITAATTPAGPAPTTPPTGTTGTIDVTGTVPPAPAPNPNPTPGP